MDYLVLWDELTNDPAGLGYADPGIPSNDATNVGLINGLTEVTSRNTLSSAEIYEQVDVAEFQALTDLQKVYVRDIFGLGSDINVGVGSKARLIMVQIFGAQSATIQALAAYAQITTSRSAVRGLGEVSAGDIAVARQAYG